MMLEAADVTRSVQSHADAIKRQEFTKEVVFFFFENKTFCSQSTNKPQWIKKPKFKG